MDRPKPFTAGELKKIGVTLEDSQRPIVTV